MIMKSNNFKGKVALLTAAASDIGRVTAIAFALEGAGVVAAYFHTNEVNTNRRR